MMSGMKTRGEHRSELLKERDDRIAEAMKRRRNVAAIAEIEGLEYEYARRQTVRIAKDRKINYQPAENDRGVGFSDESRRFRINLSDLLADFTDKPGVHPLQVCNAVGLTQAQQKMAKNKGGSHNFTIRQLERLAELLDMSFEKLMLIALLNGYDDTEKTKMKEVLKYLKL